jgi:hypothetical protein
VFDRFYSAFEKVPAGQSVRAPFRDPRLVPSSGYVDLVEHSAGCSFNNPIRRDRVPPCRATGMRP